jgi:hypothetical protein
MDKDKITTSLGALIAGATAAQPVINGVTTNSLHSQDYFQLVTAVFMGIFAFFTNKQ